MYEDIKTAALYVRYSSASQTEQSIEGQIRVCQEFADRHGIQIVETYADRATSASKDIEKRTEFLRMIRDSEKHPFDAVIVYKLDRFARNRYDSANYKFRLKKNRVQLISATENISNDPEGIILESVLEGMAEFYSAELSQKIYRGMRESAYKNQYLGGTIPFGYKVVNKHYEIDEETAPYVREAFQRFLSGDSIAAICRSFNARGIRTAKNAKFGRSSFAKIFRNEKYIGVYKHEDYQSNAIPPIIDLETWDKVQNKLKEIKPPGQYKAKLNYLLSGKFYCGRCGNPMVAGKTTKPKGDFAYYTCRGKKTAQTDCKSKNIRKDFIESLVLQDAYAMLTDDTIEMLADAAMRENQRELETTTNIPAIKNRLAVIKGSLDNITKAIEIGSAPDTLVKRMVELEQEKKDLESELKKEERFIPQNIDRYHIIHWLESLRSGDINNEAFQKQLIALFVNSVTIWDEEDPGHFTVTIAYNLTDLPQKTYKTEVGFKPQTWKLEVKSDFIIVHTISSHHRIGKYSWHSYSNYCLKSGSLESS